MLRYECGQNPYEMRRKAIMQFVDAHAVAYVGAERKDKIKMVTPTEFVTETEAE